MSDDPVQLSLKLCKALERIGVSASMRTMYRDTSISSEIIETLTHMMVEQDLSLYRFGSSCEGTTTPDMGSDIDVVGCDEYLPVIENIREAPSGFALLALTSRYTLPGYVKLQVVQDGIPLTIHNYNTDYVDTIYDSEGRVCMKHLTTQGMGKQVNERNGPADTISTNPSVPPKDYVISVRSKSFPHIAKDSLQKCIPCGWFSNDDVEKMKRFGMLYVGVGYQSSEERDIEWRMSFSLQERELMLALNPTQHKCYVLLKTIKNLITAHPDVGKSLTSYHCKTCLFTIITETSLTIWTEENLVKCTFICLTELINWISRGYCPNFFINQSNMFDRHEFRQARERLLYYMRDVLREWPRLLYHIQSDHLGEALRGLAGKQIDENRTDQVYDVLYRACEVTCRCQNSILDYCLALPSNQHIICYLFKQLCYLTSIDTITEHTQEQTQRSIRKIEPFVHKLYAQCLASVAFSTQNLALRHQLLEASTRHLRQGKNGDVMSGKLLEATILYRMGSITACRDVLEQIERQIMHGAVVSICQCYPGHPHYGNDYLERNVSSGYINQENIMASAVAPCTMFLPSQSQIIPKALQYEMYRGVYASPVSTDEAFRQWYNFAVVDSKIYLHFMQYLVYSDLNQPTAQRVAIDQLWKTLDRDRNLSHRETAYNLLGWIYIQEGRLHEAMICLWHSLGIRQDQNAAKWHISALLGRLAGQRSNVL